jgi:hypothetical protein
MKAEAEKESGFCLAIRVSGGKQLVRDFGLINKCIFGQR